MSWQIMVILAMRDLNGWIYHFVVNTVCLVNNWIYILTYLYIYLTALVDEANQHMMLGILPSTNDHPCKISDNCSITNEINICPSTCITKCDKRQSVQHIGKMALWLAKRSVYVSFRSRWTSFSLFTSVSNCHWRPVFSINSSIFQIASSIVVVCYMNW